MAAMRRVHDESGGYLLDPHSAVGVHALDSVAAVRAACAGAPTVCVLTAHPAKFDEAVRRAGLQPQPIARVEALKALPHKFRWLRAPAGGSRRQKLQEWAREIKSAVELQAEVGAVASPRPRSKL